jgi:cytoskeletal protein RodZ
MVSVIAFLTVTNIALGYGLAVYVNKNFGTLIFTRSKKQKAPLQAVVESPETTAEVAKASSRPTAQIESTLEHETSVSATPSIPIGNSETPVTEIAASDVSKISASEPVDEENVLAGIEEFRSQLAKMSEASEPLTAEPERELVGAAN